MFATIVKKIFGSKSARDVKRLRPLVAKINALEEQYQSLTEEQLKAKTQEFKDRYAKGESLDSMMCEAFAVVKNACRRMVGRTYQVCGHDLVWDMIPFDVQIIGGIVLHQGKIAEMATGEGKTLVATMPLYLNALSGHNCQLVTVNDYLALRDSQWVGRVFEYLGLTVGCIQNSMHSAQRKAQYACDITYGTNSEFGFDYLRDMGMATSKEQLVQRDYYYVIVDEVDSILIDEARTPLIISGPVNVSTHQFDKLQPLVSALYRKQGALCDRLLKEAKDVIDRRDEGKATDEEFDGAIRKLLQVKFGMPRHKQLARILEAAPTFAFDTETTGTDAHTVDLVGVSFATEKGRAWYVPIARPAPVADDLFSFAAAPQAPSLLHHFAAAFADPSKTLIAQNAKYDMTVLGRYGITFGSTVVSIRPLRLPVEIELEAVVEGL